MSDDLDFGINGKRGLIPIHWYHIRGSGGLAIKNLGGVATTPPPYNMFVKIAPYN